MAAEGFASPAALFARGSFVPVLLVHRGDSVGVTGTGLQPPVPCPFGENSTWDRKGRMGLVQNLPRAKESLVRGVEMIEQLLLHDLSSGFRFCAWVALGDLDLLWGSGSWALRVLGSSKINIVIPKGDCTVVNSARDKAVKQMGVSAVEEGQETENPGGDLCVTEGPELLKGPEYLERS